MAHLVALPVVGEALAAVAHARLVDRDLVGAGADAGVGLVLAAVRLDDQVVVAEQVGQVGVGLLQREHDFLAVGLDALDALHVAERAGLRLLVGMALERGGHVLGGHRLAVVELDAVADLAASRPWRRRTSRSPRRCGSRARRRATARRSFRPSTCRRRTAPASCISAGSRLLVDSPPTRPAFSDAALDRACGARGAGKQRVGEGRGDAERCGPAEKITPAQFAGMRRGGSEIPVRSTC